MLEFKQTADPHSMEVRQDGKRIAYLRWHPVREPLIEFAINDGFTGRVSAQNLRVMLFRLSAEYVATYSREMR